MAAFRMTAAVGRVLREFLADPDAPQYGFQLMHACKLASGSLYPILTRLEHAGWLEGHLETVDAAAAGRPARRYYRLTADGVINARRELAVLSEQLRPPAIGRTIPQGGWA